jgi:hypothetical protein
MKPRKQEPPAAPPRGNAPWAAVALLPCLVVAGCSLDIVRFREGRKITAEEFEKLEVDRTTREQALESLGAPDKLEWKSGDDYLWYDYADVLDVGLRFRLPFSFFGYQHTFLRLSENSEFLNSLQLVFNEDQVLKYKRLHLSRAYEPAPEEGTRWRFHVTPHVEHSVLLLGDAGVEDFNEVFENGPRAGLDLGFQPVPVFALFLSGSVHQYQGQSFRDGADKLEFEDLELYQMEIGIRLTVPLSLLPKLGDFEEVKRVLFYEDDRRLEGFRLYLLGSTGGAINGNVPVKVNGARAGNFYDSGFLFSGTLGGGIEYAWRWGAAFLGASYVTVDPFDEGNSPVKDDASSFQSLLVGGGVDIKF